MLLYLLFAFVTWALLVLISLEKIHQFLLWAENSYPELPWNYHTGMGKSPRNIIAKLFKEIFVHLI
jgi:hypothetical protein